jgi:hypothetical protein
MNAPQKLLFALLSCLLFSCPASSQSSVTRYAFDNFDTATGVQVRVEAPVKKRGRKVRQTAQFISSPNDTFANRTESSLYVESPAMNMAVSKSLDGFTTGDQRIDTYIAEAGARYNVDPVLLYSIMHQESTFKRNAVSPKGARGLMQLMPGTAARFGVSNIFDPQQNIEGGARYVRLLLNMFDGDVALALAGYNAGEGAVLRYGRQIPPYRETQEYVRRITNRYALMRDPDVARRAVRVSRDQVVAVRTEKTIPLALYERNVFAIRTPDGRLQLVSQ